MSTAASSLRFAARRCQQCRIASRAPIRAASIRQFTSSTGRYEAETPSKPISEESPQEMIDNFYKTILSDPAMQKEQEQIIQQMTPRNSPLRSFRTEAIPTNPKPKAGFFNLGEKKGTMEEDPEYEEDDISAIAHGQLEQHREFREYARIAAWEMPLLTSMHIFPPMNWEGIILTFYRNGKAI
jgi:small subunit ribosomal protein S35